MVNDKKKKEVRENYFIFLEQANAIINVADNIEKQVGDLKIQFIKATEKAESWKKIMNPPYTAYNFFSEGFMDHINDLRKLSESGNTFMGSLRQNLPALTTTAVSMNSHVDSGSYELRSLLNRSNDPQIISLTSDLETPTLSEQRSELVMILQKIDEEASQKFIAAWQAYYDNTKEYWINFPAFQMREVISHLLEKLAPDVDVKRMPWCFKVEGRPTQIARAIYAIIGNKPGVELTIHEDGASTTDPHMEIVIKAAKRIRDKYSNLNSYAHYRNKPVPDNIKPKIQVLLMEVMQSIKELLTLHEINFTK